MEVIKVILSDVLPAVIAGVVSVILANKAAKREKEKEQNEVVEKLDALSCKLDSHIQEDCEAKADEGRLRVLRFGDEVRRGIQHTEEHWTDILRDIDRYEAYCDSHPNYENNRATRTIQYLKNIFDEHLENNDFLK